MPIAAETKLVKQKVSGGVHLPLRHRGLAVHAPILAQHLLAHAAPPLAARHAAAEAIARQTLILAAEEAAEGAVRQLLVQAHAELAPGKNLAVLLAHAQRHSDQSVGHIECYDLHVL